MKKTDKANSYSLSDLKMQLVYVFVTVSAVIGPQLDYIFFLR